MKAVSLITGAGRGIGQAVARLLAENNFAVALAARTEADLLDTSRLISSTDETILRLPLDVADPAAVQAAVNRIVDRFGRLDAIVQCAGVAPLLPMERMTSAIWRDVIDTNLSGAFHIMHAAWPIFRRQRSGVVVNISSESSRDPFDGFAAYGAAKAGLNLLGKALAKEGKPIGVRVHTIAPAAVETRMFRRLVPPEQFPPDQTLTPESVARVVLQCINGDLACTSGEVIHIHRTVG